MAQGATVRALLNPDYLWVLLATHSSILARIIPWTVKPGRLQSMQSQRVRHDWATEHAQLREGSALWSISAEFYLIGLNSLLLSSYGVLTACRVQFLLSKPCQWKTFKIFGGKAAGDSACGPKQHPQIHFQTQSHYLYYTSLKAQLPPQAYLRVKEKQPLAYHSKFISLVPACCSSL